MMKVAASFFCLLLLILGSMSSATASRTSGSWMKTLPEIHFQDVIDTIGYEGKSGYDKTARRLDLENTDYEGTGANDRHQPKTPGRA